MTHLQSKLLKIYILRITKLNRFFRLLAWELFIQNKVNNFIKYLSALFLFCTTSIALVNTYENIDKFGIVFTIIYIPIALISFSAHILKSDLEDGTVELLLSSYTSLEIVLAKFAALYLNSLIASLLNLPIIFLAFNLSCTLFSQLALVISLELLIVCALVVLSGTVQSYFRSNTNFLPQLLMTLLLPAIIFSGLAIENPTKSYLIFILLGINLVLVPTMLALASYLTRNIFGASS